MPKRILLVGDIGQDEFSAVVEWLRMRCTFFQVADLPHALDLRSDVPPPDVIVLAQSYPCQWSDGAVDQLHRRWPLARLLSLVGNWCEGESRTGRPCQGVWRIDWHDFPRRLEPFLAEDDVETPPSWNLPRLATETERLVRDVLARRGRNAEHMVAGSKAGLVTVLARTLDAFESFRDACDCLGWDAAWQHDRTSRSVTGANVAIWDALDSSELEWQQIDAFVRRQQRCHTIVVLGFPRPIDRRRAAQLGAALLAKPFQLPDLRLELEQSASTLATIADDVHC